jgi:subfamily B ATP-binding cassette protein MsbA
MEESDVSFSEQLTSLKQVMGYRPKLTVFIILFGSVAALLEGLGLSFLFPIIKVAQSGQGATDQTDGVAGAFFELYELLNVPFTLEFMILGVALVMSFRYVSSFTMKWLGGKLVKEYERNLKSRSFERALHADVSYYDREGSDDILNTIITQTRYAGRVIKRIISSFQQISLAAMYVVIALVVAPVLTVLAAVFLGSVTYLVRNVIEPGYTVGDRVARANE